MKTIIVVMLIITIGVHVMKIAVVCANGRAGKLITKEAVNRGLDVTAIVRGKNETVAHKAVIKDIFALTKADLQGFDCVIDAFGAWREEDLPNHVKSSQHLCDLLSHTETRLIIVGGAGSLYTDKEHKQVVSDSPDFPAEYMPLAKAQGEELKELRRRDDVRWTFISPAADFQAEGERTGQYILAGEELTLNSRGESVISYADYAIAVIDEIVSGSHIRQRISVVRK